MEPISSNNKIVSLHMQGCSGSCPNASSCYHIKKNTFNGHVNVPELRISVMRSGLTVHESICGSDNIMIMDRLMNYKNYNITISSKDISLPIANMLPKEQIQISVYGAYDIIQFKDYQKLFLIKDHESRELANRLMAEEGVTKIHYNLDMSYVKSMGFPFIMDLINRFQLREEKSQTMDSCLTSWIVNGECPYTENYVDITFDGTVRYCPYKSSGTNVNISDMVNFCGVNELFKIRSKEHLIEEQLSSCYYRKLFQGEKNGRISTDSNLQNPNEYNRSGSDSQLVRRFSLRS